MASRVPRKPSPLPDVASHPDFIGCVLDFQMFADGHPGLVEVFASSAEAADAWWSQGWRELFLTRWPADVKKVDQALSGVEEVPVITQQPVQG